MNLRNGTIIGNYKVISPIGKGGMGEAYLAQDTKLERQVALKVLLDEVAGQGKLNRAGIRSENIMLRDDGFVKVLDFGLAKLTAAPTGPVESEDATRAQVNTRPGVVMGTVLYMSPEQARGREIDASNIWSMPIDGGSSKQVTNFATDQIAWFDVSGDGKPTLFSRGSTTKDVVLIRGFRK